jgi:hypothetical protein
MGTLIINNYRLTDSDANTYIASVEEADGQTLEWNTKAAINKFIVGCKTDGIWDAIKASCIMAGARTLDGALTPLKGTAPTNFNFVANDYNRKTGLMGNGFNKYLNSNRLNNADPQDDKHIAVWRTKSETRDITRCALGSGTGISLGESQLLTTNANRYFRVNYYGTTDSISDNTAIPGFWGASRSTSAETSTRYDQSSGTIPDTSNLPVSNNLFVFSRDLGFSPSDAWISFYSIGTSLDLALLDTRVSQLITDINNAF